MQTACAASGGLEGEEGMEVMEVLEVMPGVEGMGVLGVVAVLIKIAREKLVNIPVEELGEEVLEELMVTLGRLVPKVKKGEMALRHLLDPSRG